MRLEVIYSMFMKGFIKVKKLFKGLKGYDKISFQKINEEFRKFFQHDMKFF